MLQKSYTFNSVSDCRLATREPFGRYSVAITSYMMMMMMMMMMMILMMMSSLHYTNTLSWDGIVLAHPVFVVTFIMCAQRISRIWQLYFYML